MLLFLSSFSAFVDNIEFVHSLLLWSTTNSATRLLACFNFVTHDREIVAHLRPEKCSVPHPVLGKFEIFALLHLCRVILFPGKCWIKPVAFWMRKRVLCCSIYVTYFLMFILFHLLCQWKSMLCCCVVLFPKWH